MKALLKRVPTLAWIGAVLVVLVVYLGFVRRVALPTDTLLLTCIVTLLAATLLLRRLPFTALIVLTGLVFVASFVDRFLAHGVLLVFMNVALVCVAALRPRRVSLTAAAIVFVMQTVYLFTFISGRQGDGPDSWTLLVLLGAVVCWLVGDMIRTRRAHAAERRTQAVTQAATDERLRIARELHDIVAHSIGIIAIQAGVGRRVIETQPEEARKALDTIEATSRETLAGLRGALGRLRQTDPGPVRGLAELDKLIDSTLLAGVRIELRRTGAVRPLPPEVDLSAYRIIQEAVTNVVRHAGTDHCTVTVDDDGTAVAIEVLDEGHGCAVPQAGYGLVGMRERTGLLHGEFYAGPRAEGGFRVTARLPVPVAAGAAR
jgi:signal transduction histidine kinase